LLQGLLIYLPKYRTMAVHKLVYDIQEEEESQLLAIHTNMEMDRLAFFMNKHSNVMLAISKKPILVTIQKKTIDFTHFFALDDLEGFRCYLIENQVEVPEEISTPAGLFNNQMVTATYHFLPELKQVPYLFKIEGLDAAAKGEEWMKTLQKIPQVASAYAVAWTQIKNKNYLIFN
jgi:hypothetical protein